MDQKKAIETLSKKILEACENTEKVYFAGKKDEYESFWDAKQPSQGYPAGMGGDYGGRWTVETFRPKYDLVPTYSQYMFYVNSLKIDLVEHLKSIGRKLDFSQCKNMNCTFLGAAFTHIGSVCGNGVGMSGVFQSCANLVTIDEFGHCDGGDLSADTTTTFDGCTALENITIKGKFTGNIYFHWSTKLTGDSIRSIVAALSDNVSGKKLQLSKTAVDEAFAWYVGDTKVDGSQSGAWSELEASKPNWTITLV